MLPSLIFFFYSCDTQWIFIMHKALMFELCVDWSILSELDSYFKIMLCNYKNMNKPMLGGYHNICWASKFEPLKVAY
jgi:hypothetical protein